MIIYINGRGMNAPELKAYISELEAENKELKWLLKVAVEDYPDLTDMWRYADKALKLIGGSEND